MVTLTLEIYISHGGQVILFKLGTGKKSLSVALFYHFCILKLPRRKLQSPRQFFSPLLPPLCVVTSTTRKVCGLVSFCFSLQTSEFIQVSRLDKFFHFLYFSKSVLPLLLLRLLGYLYSLSYSGTLLYKLLLNCVLSSLLLEFSLCTELLGCPVVLKFPILWTCILFIFSHFLRQCSHFVSLFSTCVVLSNR